MRNFLAGVISPRNRGRKNGSSRPQRSVMRRLNSHCPRSPMSSLATCSPASRPTSTERIVPRPPSAVKIAMATRLVPPPAAQHPNMPPYVAGDAQFPKDVAVSGRSNRPLTTKARATLARPDRTLPASAKSRYKEDERSDNEIGLTEENSAWHALNSRQAVLLPETCVGHIDRRAQEGSSRLHALLYACYPRLVNGYV